MDLSKLIILCVDDQQEFLDVLKSALEPLPFRIETLTNPIEAIDFLSHHQHEVAFIISDYRMPEMDGLQLRAKVNEKWQDIPFVILSAFVDRDIALAGVNLKISAFLEKPFDINELHTCIEKNMASRLQDIEERTILRQGFLEEAGDILIDLEPLILNLENAPDDEHMLSAIYRNVHTIKGASGVLERPEFTQFLHHYEDVLGKIRNHEMKADDRIISQLLNGFDKLTQALKLIADDPMTELDHLNLEGCFAENGDQETQQTAQEPTSNKTSQSNDQTSNAKKEGVQVPLDLLDEFMNLSGEITVIRNMVNKLVKSLEKKIHHDEDLSRLGDLLDEMHKINSSMQGQISELRKTPASAAVRRVPRMMRDLTKQLGKKANFQVHGGDLRIDTSIAQILGGCLTHMIRNCLDHGLEHPQERAAAKKDESGEITLSFNEENEQIIVNLKDDGRGIDPRKVSERLLKNGAFSEEQIAMMTDVQIIQQIFSPGFSTAEKVTDVSGRGVGMDMVLSSIQGLGGQVNVQSTVGTGTTVTMTMPVPKSVVIISALIVQQASERFAIPQECLVRLLSLDASRRQKELRHLEGADVLDMQGELLPIKYLSDVLNLPRPDFDEDDSMNIVVLKSDNQHFGLVVDAIYDAEDIVVKNIPSFAQCANTYKGATFLGDGTVGLILDIDGIANREHLIEKGSAKLSGLVAEHQASDFGHSFDLDLLIVGLNAEGSYAIPLKDVYRLEHIETSSIEITAGKQVCIYRDHVMRIIDVTATLGLGPAVSKDRESVPILVVSIADQHFGLIIDHIRDLVPQTEAIDKEGYEQPGIAGATRVKGHTMTVLDVFSILEAAGLGRWLEVVPVPEKSQTSSAAQPLPPMPESEEPKAAGWGLF